MNFIKKHPYLTGEIIDILIGLISFSYIMTHDAPDTWIEVYLWMFLAFGSLAGIILVPIVIAVCRGIIDKRARNRKKQESKEYREKYITEFIVENEYFGHLVFEKDINNNSYRFIRGDIMEMSFGIYNYLDVEMEIDGVEDMLYRALNDLAKVYRDQKKYIDGLYDQVLDTCYDWEECDSQGNPVDMAYVKKYFSLCAVALTTFKDEVTVSLYGTLLNDDERGIELLGCHMIEADINCTKNEVTYDLIG